MGIQPEASIREQSLTWWGILSIGKHDGVDTCIRSPTRLPLYTCASEYGAAALCSFSFLLPYPWLPVQIGTNRCLDLGKSVSPPTGEHLSDGANIDVLQANFTPFLLVRTCGFDLVTYGFVTCN